ncbi:unnamed protein product, partial [Amoebophrya sp. A120]
SVSGKSALLETSSPSVDICVVRNFPNIVQNITFPYVPPISFFRKHAVLCAL